MCYKRLHLRHLFLSSTLLLTLAGFVSSCSTVSYIGNYHPPTSRVDVFYSERDVPYEHQVTGHLSEMTGGFNNEQKTRDKLIRKAMSVGADAIIITGFEHAGTDDIKRYIKAEAIRYID